jgi:hypothetical protein
VFVNFKSPLQNGSDERTALTHPLTFMHAPPPPLLLLLEPPPPPAAQ